MPTPNEKNTEPPEGWQVQTSFGFMGFDATPAGRLVRLADVLRWLRQHPAQIPHANALKALCDAIPDDVMQWLYRVGGENYAKPVPSGELFGYQTQVQIDAEAARARQEAMRRNREAADRSWGTFSVPPS